MCALPSVAQIAKMTTNAAARPYQVIAYCR